MFRFETIIFIMVGGLSGFLNSLYRFYKSGKMELMKSIIRVFVGAVLAGFFSFVIPHGYEMLRMNPLQTTVSISFVVGLLGIEIIKFATSKEISFFIDLLQKK